LVSGRVQGVFFRDDCRREAVSAGVAGWVRNRPDGRVEAVFEGEPDAVYRLVSWCRTGPPSARVSEVEVFSEEPGGESGFRVL
jgi:acylphosphatase